MKKSIFKVMAALLVMAAWTGASAQKRIYLCQDYTSGGEPVGVSNTWNIKPTGGNVYILYKNDGVNFKPGNISLYIDKKNGDTYGAFDTKTITPYKHMSWLLYDFKFTKAGDYKISVVDNLGNYLATEYCTVQITGTSSSSSSSTTSSAYSNSSVKICSSVDANGNAISPTGSLRRGNSSVSASVLIKNPEGFKTSELIVDIYIGEGTAGFVETKRFTVSPDQTWLKFDYTYYVNGHFRFAVYNQDNQYINTGYVDIQ